MVPYLLGYFLLSANVRKYICTIPRLFKDITHDIILRPTIKQPKTKQNKKLMNTIDGQSLFTFFFHNIDFNAILADFAKVCVKQQIVFYM